MAADTPADREISPREPRWPWLLLGLAGVWVVLVRVPLVLNAAGHLDSDLAVDGLTLLDATQGHWRWHYPGTPFIGIGPVLLSLPQALAGGVTPATLVSGGTVAFLGLLVATFLLAWWAFGPRVAAWSLVPLACASSGAVWLSGRITGGHLVAAAWHAGAFALLVRCLRGGGRWAAFALGAWCGVGVYLDSMFVVTLAGLVVAAVGYWLAGGPTRRGLVLGVVFVAGFLAGVWPRAVGAWVDPYSCYDGQFALVTRPGVLAEHAGLLGRECLPRLICGHALPGLATAPAAATVNGVPDTTPGGTGRAGPGAWAVAAAVVALGLWAAGSLALLGRVIRAPDRAGRAVAAGLVLAAGATVAGFVVNRNIFNSDNYRYLVSLLVPGAVGFGLVIDGLWRRGTGGRIGAAVLALAFAVVMTADLKGWYAGFGWVDVRGLPVRRPVNDPVLGWLDVHPDLTWVEGGYWDVYRLAFLSGGRVRGVPLAIYPNRFPDWARRPGEPRLVLLRPMPGASAFSEAALQAGGRVVLRLRGVVGILIP
jgi:hypothetical protein